MVAGGDLEQHRTCRASLAYAIHVSRRLGAVGLLWPGVYGVWGIGRVWGLGARALRAWRVVELGGRERGKPGGFEDLGLWGFKGFWGVEGLGSGGWGIGGCGFRVCRFPAGLETNQGLGYLGFRGSGVGAGIVT